MALGFTDCCYDMFSPDLGKKAVYSFYPRQGMREAFRWQQAKAFIPAKEEEFAGTITLIAIVSCDW